MYIVIETDSDCSDEDWRVLALYENVREASKFAWMATLNKYTIYDSYVKYWCDPSKTEKCASYGVQYHILDWNMATNMPNGTWYLETKAVLLELGDRGECEFRNTINKYLEVLNKYVPSKLWNECMTFEKHESV